MERKYVSNNKFCDWEENICRNIIVVSHYHYFMDHNMSEGKCTLQHISCACVEIIYQLEHAWIPRKYVEQSIYASVTECKYN